MKKVSSVILILVMLVGLFGCNTKKESFDIGNGEMPESVSVFAWRSASLGGDVIDYNDIYSFQEIEKKTGVHVDWTIPPGTGYEEKFNLMMASGDMTDVIVSDWINKDLTKYIEDEAIISLEGIKEYAPNFMKYLNEHPELTADCLLEDGTLAHISFIRDDRELSIYYGPLMRIDWVEKLGLNIPTNAEELYTVLKAFKERDPNGNGEADEIPMTGLAAENITRLLGMFDTTDGFYVQDGKIKFGFMEPEFEEGLAYIAKLYNEGLIDVDYVFQDRAKQDGKVTNHKVGFMYSYQPTVISNSMSQKDPEFRFGGIPHFKDKQGRRVSFNKDYITKAVATSAAISSNCKNPSGVLKWLDYFFGDEGVDIMNYGIEGDTYNKIDDKKVYIDKILNDKSSSPSVYGRHFGAFNGYFPTLQKWGAYEQSLADFGRKAIETWNEDVYTEYTLPHLMFTGEEKGRISELLTSIETYTDEKIDKIILGQENVSGIVSAREQLKSMGIEELIKIYQSAYDRRIKKISSLK